jgi:hypothetical protein
MVGFRHDGFSFAARTGATRPGRPVVDGCFLPTLTFRWLFCYSVNPHRPRHSSPSMDLDVEALKARIAALKTEHRELDDAITRLVENAPYDPLHLQRLKKRKLALKDLIIKLESKLLPDIIA